MKNDRKIVQNYPFFGIAIKREIFYNRCVYLDCLLEMGTANSMATKPNGRVAYYDRLRILAMIGVVLVHVCAGTVTELAADGFTWHLTNLLDAASRFAVPVYLMLTGALLLGDDRALSLRDILKRRMVPVAVPLAVWTVIYGVLRFAWQGMLHEDFVLTQALSSLFSKPIEVHLWYLYALLAIYLVLPFLRLIVKHAPRKLIVYGVALWLIYSSLMRAAGGLFPQLALPVYGNLDFLGGYLGYVLLGWVLATTERVPSRPLLITGAVVCTLITTAATYLMTRSAGELNAVFYQYFMPNVVGQSICVFLWMRTTSETASSWCAPVAELSFGVYLTHQLFVVLLTPLLRILPAILTPLLATPIVAVLSVILTVLLRKTKVTRFLFLGGR